MRLSAPALTLAAFLGLATALLLGGVVLARRETTERIERDRGLHYRLADALTGEIQRLDALYETHLAELARPPAPEPRDAFVAACQNIVGVRRFSLLHPTAGKDVPAGKDVQLDFHAPGAKSVPTPVFIGGTLFPGTPRRELTPARFFAPEASPAGWIEEPSKLPLYFQTRADETLAVLTVDDAEVRAAIDARLRAWLAEPFAPVAAGGGQDRVLSPGEGALAQSGATPTAPADWVLPVRGRFGVWRVESWDTRTIRQSWHAPTLIASGAGAVLVALLGAFLAARLGSAQRLAEQRVSFVNHVSHELRTPLMNMLLNADLAADLLDEAPAEARRRLSLLREEGQRLARLTENVLTWSRRERGKLQIESRPCDLEAVLADVARLFEPLLARRAIAFHRHGAPVAGPRVLDPDALTQIVANLFSNVEKYAGREATLDFTVAADAAMLTLIVADDGPGIPHGAEARIFAPFERLDDSVNSGSAGAGLGLAIARDLATRLGGTLRLIRTERGACFELRLPAPVQAGLPC